MSRAGKFIPGQGRNKTKTESVKGSPVSGASGGAIRATPEPTKAAGHGGGGGDNKMKPVFGRLGRPVEKGQRRSITLVGVMITALIVGGGGYVLYVKPAWDQAKVYQQQALDAQKKLDDAKAAEAAKEAQQHEVQVTLAAEKATAYVLTLPVTGQAVAVNINGVTGHPSASATDLGDGMQVDHDKPLTVTITAKGYEQIVAQEAAIHADGKQTFGPYTLIPNNGTIALTSPLTPVVFSLRGPIDPANAGSAQDRDGTLSGSPASFPGLPEGDYTVSARYEDWELPPFKLKLSDKEVLNHEIDFPFASITISSTPSGAKVREGREVRGITPFTLDHQRPGTHFYTVDYPLYKIEKITVEVPDAGNVNQAVPLKPTKDFKNSSGMDMVWIDDQGYWVGKFEVRQEEFAKVMGYNPSDLRQPNHPVDSVSWDEADQFCKKLTDQDRAANVLPADYHYMLPSELEWATYNSDAKLETSALSLTRTAFTSSQAVGYSEPNSYGLYDTLGNVQEWCRDTFGDDPNNKSIRGGDWLSSLGSFPSVSSRIGAGVDYKDKFTGFRVILEKGQ